MEYFPALLTPQQTDEGIARVERHFAQHGFGLYAAELIETNTFIGFIGLNIPNFQASFMPAVEIGWRLAFDYWGKGLATEGACAAVEYAFQTLHLPSLVSFTVPANLRSCRVMEKLGMVHDASGDFEHPNLPPGHPLRRHVLYRLHSRM
jgi:RimJ/RimL family protein N-acetyltransferase